MPQSSDKPGRDENEIVPLGALRPSRQHFGEPGPAQNGGQQARTSHQQPARRPQQRPTQQTQQPRKPAPRQTSQQQRPVERAPQRRPVRQDAFVSDLSRAGKARPAAPQPSAGWRTILHKATGGVVNLGPSSGSVSEQQLLHRLRRPVTDGTVGVFSRKGGVGKTTISAYLGLTLAVNRGGRIVALDGDSEAGSLGWLLAPEAPSTLAELASANPTPVDYAGLRHFTTTTEDGLEVIIGEPAEEGPISTTGLEAVADQLARHYDVSIFDTGAGVTRATGRVLVNRARVLLLVMGPSVDSVRAAERTLAWLEESPEAAAPNVKVVAVINGIPTNAKESHIRRIESHFEHSCSAVVRIPWDAHLAAGSTSVSLDLLAKPTRQAFLELASVTVGQLSHPVRRGVKTGARRAS